MCRKTVLSFLVSLLSFAYCKTITTAKMDMKITVLLLIVAVWTIAEQVHFQNYLENKSTQCGTETIVCDCGYEKGNDHSEIFELEMRRVAILSTGKSKCVLKEDPYEACIDAKISTTNTSAKVSCSYRPKRSLSSRSKRQYKPCHTSVLDHSRVNCTKYPWKIECAIHCYPGYALRFGGKSVLKLKLTCKFAENEWRPKRFQDCQPFMSCAVKLVAPGMLDCKTPFDAAPYCRIACYDYGKRKYSQLRKYQCVDDTYGDTLPSCAVLLPKSELLIPWPNNYVFPTPADSPFFAGKK